jgi:hypothetical protein
VINTTKAGRSTRRGSSPPWGRRSRPCCMID